VEFNVLEHSAINISHISKWQFASGSSSLHYPEVYIPRQSRSVFWLTNMKTQLKLDWALNSSYTANAIGGKSNSDTLIYSNDGIWSLLNFIQDHRSSLHDSEAISQESILLSFEAKLDLKTSSLMPMEPLSALTLIRLTLYGLDSETKQHRAIEVPIKFPSYAPVLARKGTE